MTDLGAGVGIWTRRVATRGLRPTVGEEPNDDGHGKDSSEVMGLLAGSAACRRGLSIPPRFRHGVRPACESSLNLNLAPDEDIDKFHLHVIADSHFSQSEFLSPHSVH